MNVHIRAAEVTQRFARPPIARFKDAPGMGRLFEPLPSDGQAKLERHVESRRRGSFLIQLDAGQIVEGVPAISDQIDNSIKPALAARNLDRRPWFQPEGDEAGDIRQIEGLEASVIRNV